MVKIEDCVRLNIYGYYLGPDGNVYFLNEYGSFKRSNTSFSSWLIAWPYALYDLEDIAW